MTCRLSVRGDVAILNIMLKLDDTSHSKSSNLKTKLCQSVFLDVAALSLAGTKFCPFPPRPFIFGGWVSDESLFDTHSSTSC